MSEEERLTLISLREMYKAKLNAREEINLRRALVANVIPDHVDLLTDLETEIAECEALQSKVDYIQKLISRK